MPLDYALFPFLISVNPAHRVAVPQNTQSYTLNDIFDRISVAGSTVTRAENLAVFEEFCSACEAIILEGNAINLPLFNLALTITGTFTGDDDAFDPSRHTVQLRLTPGKRLQAVAAKVAVRKVKPKAVLPQPLHFYDLESEGKDGRLTPGGAARLTGYRLKFDETAPEQGIFLIGNGNGKTVKIARKLLLNKPAELLFMLPPADELPGGTYRLEVRTIPRNNKNLKSGALPVMLTAG